MIRPSTLLAITALLGLAFAACQANLESDCLGGPCGPETAPSPDPNAGTSSGSAGGSAAVDCSGIPETGVFPCAVYEVLKARCHVCHTEPPLMGAPFALLTYEDTRAPYGSGSTLRADRMQDMIDRRLMPPQGSAALSDEERQTLLDWLADCGRPDPEAGPECECTDPMACP